MNSAAPALAVAPEVIAAIIAHAVTEAPLECCGLLAGDPGGGASRAFPMANTRGSEDEFWMDPAEQFEVLDEARAAGHEILAVYHSHPTSPAQPSEYDISMAFEPRLVHLIISLKGGAPVAKAYLIRDGEPIEVPLVVGGAAG